MKDNRFVYLSLIAIGWAISTDMSAARCSPLPQLADTSYIDTSSERASSIDAQAMRDSDGYESAGWKEMSLGNYAEAQMSFQRSLAALPLAGPLYQGLAEAYAEQGKIDEAIITYRKLIYPTGSWRSSTAGDVRTHMSYAILLSQKGQWVEAVAMYNRALPGVVGGDLPALKSGFDPRTPDPTELQADAHIALGLDANFQYDWTGILDHKRALNEYSKALVLAPNSHLAVFYYGFGLRWVGRQKDAEAYLANSGLTQFPN